MADPYGKPLENASELGALDEVDLMEGYRDGFDGEPEPKGNRSKSYWHGWRNGAVDGGHRESDEAQAKLAADYIRQQRASREKNHD